MTTKRIEYIGEDCSIWIENSTHEEIFHLAVSETLESGTEKFSLVLSIGDMREFYKVIREALEHQEGNRVTNLFAHDQVLTSKRGV